MSCVYCYESVCVPFSGPGRPGIIPSCQYQCQPGPTRYPRMEFVCVCVCLSLCVCSGTLSGCQGVLRLFSRRLCQPWCVRLCVHFCVCVCVCSASSVVGRESEEESRTHGSELNRTEGYWTNTTQQTIPLSPRFQIRFLIFLNNHFKPFFFSFNNGIIFCFPLPHFQPCRVTVGRCCVSAACC